MASPRPRRPPGYEAVRLFLEKHGSSRFEAAWEISTLRDPPRIIERAGFRKQRYRTWKYYISPRFGNRKSVKASIP